MGNRIVVKMDITFETIQSYGIENEASFQFRLDAFGDYKTDSIILGFNGECINYTTLDEVEKKYLKKEKDTFAFGIMPYEMAETFLPIQLNGKQKGYLFLNQDYLVLDKTSGEVVYKGEKIFYENIASRLKAFQNCNRVNHQQDVAAQGAINKDIMKRLVNEDDFAISNMAYHKLIKAAKAHIEQGDIFQIVLSNHYKAPYSASPYALYHQVTSQSTMPYKAYIKLPRGEAIINSPELLVKSDQTSVYTHPIAGTRPLKGDGKDLERQKSLVADEKENAEHLMLVDLGRNDLQKISKPGSVRLTHFKEVRPFDTVYHMVSEVVGDKAYERLLDPIRATFPAGTVSGAPKIMAMSLIHQLENNERGYYAGTTFIIDESDHLEACINLRSIFIEEGCVRVQAGSGIVQDSNAEDERQEVLNKCYGQLVHVKGGSHAFDHR